MNTDKGEWAMRKILIADDEERMRRLVGDFLRREGFLILEAANGREAIEIFEAEPDLCLVILDVMMPLYDGWAVCREIRQKSMVPVIMLTARGEETDELFGFELGADEYISKPFSPQVLIARVQALLRRASAGSKSVYDYPGLEIDVDARHVKVDGEIIVLSPKEFELLAYMAANEGRALSRDQILNAVWDYNFYGDPRTVDTHVKKVRLKLGRWGEYIQTVRGVGYRFEVSND
jgi:DNA-binding response OmpR family regulator